MDLNDIDFDDDDELAMQQEMKNSAVQDNTTMKSEEVLEGWESVKCESGESESTMFVQVDTSELPLVTNDDGKQVLRFFWLDAFEDRYHQAGSVYLFGKVWIESAKTYVSCCVTIKNIERRIYILPRATKMNMKTKTDTDEPVTMMDVYQEFNETVTEKHKITKFKSKKASKKYAFEKVDVPAESDYLEVHYAADLPALPSNLQGETFSHVFGTNTSSLENLLIDRKMKGPCWLDLHNVQPSNPPISWCKVEAVVTRPDHVTIHTSSLPPPPLVVMTLNLRTLPNPKTHQNEIPSINTTSLFCATALQVRTGVRHFGAPAPIHFSAVAAAAYVIRAPVIKPLRATSPKSHDMPKTSKTERSQPHRQVSPVAKQQCKAAD